MHSVLLLAALLTVAHGYGYYRDSMPNGRFIPCDSSCVGYCEGFGHVLNDGSSSCNGGGEHPNHYLSTFGNSWQQFNTTWTVGMCMADSDGDGFSNGDEMGDPCCTWVAGGTPMRTTNLANPAQKDSVPFPSCTLGGMPNVTLTSNFTTQSRAMININWAVPSCMCGFNVSQMTPKVVAMQATAMADPYSGNSQISVTGLEPNTMYTFSVTGFNLAGGIPLSVMVQTPATPDTAPAPPPNLQLTASTSNSITLSWDAPTNTVAGASLSASDITGYELDIAPGSTGVYSTAYTGATAKFTIPSLLPGTNYLTRVRAVNAAGVGTSSAPLNVSTAAYNGSSTSASYRSDDGAFYLGWEIDGNTITFVMTGNSLGYVAIGWGPNPTMLGADMIVGSWNSKTGTGSVIDLWSTSRNTPTFDQKQDAKFVSGAQNTTSTTITFTRLLNTGDAKQDLPILNTEMHLIWAIGSGPVSTQSSFAVHTNRGAAQVNFFTGKAQSINHDKLKNAHSGLAFFAWGMLIPFGSFVARYKRCDYGVWWFRIHVLAQSLGALLTFIAFIIMATALASENSPHFNSTHAICGLIMLVLTAGQTALGVVSHFMYDKNRRRVPIFPDRIHAVIGLAVMLFAYITIFLGFQFNHVNLGTWLLGAQCLLFAATAVFVYEFFDGRETKED
eukprot:Phypoly_transcript_03918.p1 GENE.Phypoly_transcript_03918~~Phypoly_transcript_03918.p1  ORF type:complete len:670 (+),score=101.12 Phypoly_transcript_03918:219-2228(+)